jgi:putative membrane protein
MKFKSSLFALPALLIGIFYLTPIQMRGQQIQPGGTPLDAGDSKFVIAASQDGETEVQLGAMAKEHAAAADVKSFGAMMAGDHSKANAELKALCAKRGVKLSAELDPEHQSKVDALGKKSGTSFDQAYETEMVSAHKGAIALFEGEAKTTKDPQLKAFVEATLPTLRHHLEMAQALGKTPGK